MTSGTGVVIGNANPHSLAKSSIACKFTTPKPIKTGTIFHSHKRLAAGTGLSTEWPSEKMNNTLRTPDSAMEYEVFALRFLGVKAASPSMYLNDSEGKARKNLYNPMILITLFSSIK